MDLDVSTSLTVVKYVLKKCTCPPEHEKPILVLSILGMSTNFLAKVYYLALDAAIYVHGLAS